MKVRAAGNLRPSFPPPSRTRPLAERNCPTNPLCWPTTFTGTCTSPRESRRLSFWRPSTPALADGKNPVGRPSPNINREGDRRSSRIYLVTNAFLFMRTKNDCSLVRSGDKQSRTTGNSIFVYRTILLPKPISRCRFATYQPPPRSHVRRHCFRSNSAASAALSSSGRAKSLRSRCDLASTGRPLIQPVLQPLPNAEATPFLRTIEQCLLSGQMLAIGLINVPSVDPKPCAFFAAHVAERHRRAGSVMSDLFVVHFGQHARTNNDTPCAPDRQGAEGCKAQGSGSGLVLVLAELLDGNTISVVRADINSLATIFLASCASAASTMPRCSARLRIISTRQRGISASCRVVVGK